ncbi:hypothetical protein FE784_35105 [Paenibacillus hemerocallicola]|uniref:Uncharacterized protein n=1 Tax=Paenibacillus hemerocallicola TaxID=1172614 RepID=A0A5C4SXR5_9BACL|nr:hypothetical protein [Paenibacillus hemerocallicola]TNJ61027.1 hypothetical protein FE784_35105 [Paenibacillus hemerocallicola]
MLEFITELPPIEKSGRRYRAGDVRTGDGSVRVASRQLLGGVRAVAIASTSRKVRIVFFNGYTPTFGFIQIVPLLMGRIRKILQS